MPQVQEQPTLTIAEGAIDPKSRVERGEIAETDIDRLCEALQSDEYYEAISEDAIPCCCVDGRCGNCALGPNAAGGTFSLVAGETLVDGPGVSHFRQAGQNVITHTKTMFSWLKDRGHRIGGHTGPNATSDKSDCGAQDRASEIFDYITRRPGDVRQLIESLGIEVSDELHDRISKNAADRLNEDYFANGSAIKNTCKEVAGDEAVVELEGDHREVAVVVNTQAGTTLNRQALREAFDDDLQAFNLDVAGLKKGCEEISFNPEEAHMKFVGALYYNVATAAVLAGPSLRVVVR